MTQTATKALVVASFVAFTGAGLYGADRAYRPDTQPVALAPQPGPAIGRNADEVPQPRECDSQRGIDMLCDY
jgi:hypothetical protein